MIDRLDQIRHNIEKHYPAKMREADFPNPFTMRHMLQDLEDLLSIHDGTYETIILDDLMEPATKEQLRNVRWWFEQYNIRPLLKDFDD